jgi:GAF domain-containing protein
MDVELGTGVGSEERRIAQFAGMAGRMLRQDNLEQTVQTIVELAREAELGDDVSLMVVQGRKITTVSDTGVEVRRADQLQLEWGEGPSVEAILRRRDFVSDDLRLDSRWRFWGPQAAKLGWLSALSVGLADHNTFGALTFYSRQVSSFGERELGVAEVFATYAAVALSAARDRETLIQAVEARTLVGQAQGMLMERYDIDAEQAFSVLRRYSSHTNRKLRFIASEVVERRQLPQTATGDASA